MKLRAAFQAAGPRGSLSGGVARRLAPHPGYWRPALRACEKIEIGNFFEPFQATFAFVDQANQSENTLEKTSKPIFSQALRVENTNRLGKIEFYEAHTTPWAGNAAAIGLAPAAVTSLTAATTNENTSVASMLAPGGRS